MELGFITLSVGTCASCSVRPLRACISLGGGGRGTPADRPDVGASPCVRGYRVSVLSTQRNEMGC